jgi:hypothetical protein
MQAMEQPAANFRLLPMFVLQALNVESTSYQRIDFMSTAVSELHGITSKS